MDSLGPADAFRLARLRLVRLPPEWIAVPGGGKKPVVVPIELAVGVTDDYGTDIDMFDSLDLKIDILDVDTLAPPSGVSLRLDPSPPSPSHAAEFTFTPSRGPFHNLKLSLLFSPPTPARPWPKRLSFRLSVASSSSSSAASSPLSQPSGESGPKRRMRRVVGELEQEPLETWDEKRYVFLSVRSGPLEVRIEGKEPKTASSKVQTALRTLHLPNPYPSPSPVADSSSPPSPDARPLTIVERPGLNNSTGQRLWDCAIGLSAFFSLYPDALDASIPLAFTLPLSSPPPSSSEADSPSAKRPRLDPAAAAERPKKRRRKVIDLGAGCALASMAVRRLLADERVEVLATDVEATVETTLRENLVANGQEKELAAEVLDWGGLEPERVTALSNDGQGRPLDSLTLIGSDILYNPSSHQLLLSTLLSFLRPASHPPSSSFSSSSSQSPLPPPTRALIAYKRRTEGDDAFFPLASAAGLEVKKVWEWREVGVWSFE